MSSLSLLLLSSEVETWKVGKSSPLSAPVALRLGTPNMPTLLVDGERSFVRLLQTLAVYAVAVAPVSRLQAGGCGWCERTMSTQQMTTNRLHSMKSLRPQCKLHCPCVR
jgi:hypothetical protein